MADGGTFRPQVAAQQPKGWRNRLMASPRFQAWAARFPFTRAKVRKEGSALFDLMAGFCHSQTLMALAELQIPEALLGGAVPAHDLAKAADVPLERMEVLLRAGAAIGILRIKRRKVSLTQRGAAFACVPGLSAMVKHHRAFYRDLEDPVAFFRGEIQTELADVWPYVFGQSDKVDPATATAYSDLMAQSQVLVAQDTLRLARLSDHQTLMDVGGGTGAFLAAAGAAHSKLGLHLFDLPQVAPHAQDRFDEAGLTDRAQIFSGSFRDDPLPKGADVISLVRVLYDHSDETVEALLAKVFAALPPGGEVLISEPMSGGVVPDKATDGYFALYTMAMRTGRTRSAQKISEMLKRAGFESVSKPRSNRSYVTTVLMAGKPIRT